MEVVEMMNTSAQMTLQRAILLYISHERALATLHDVKRDDKGVMRLDAGELLSHETLEKITRLLQTATTTREILPADVLLYDAGRMAWYVPALRRPIFFRTSDAEFNKAMNAQIVLYPNLLFVAEPGRLSVFALDGNARPSSESPLYRAPFYNLYGGTNGDGLMCAGNHKLPESLLVSELGLWEKGFFDTQFTHTNVHGAKLTTHREGHHGLWKAARSWSDEPFTEGDPHARYLVPLGKTVGDVLLRDGTP